VNAAEDSTHTRDFAMESAHLIPLRELDQRLSELPRTTPIVAYCRGGVRSAKALATLLDAGFDTARHLAGGINAWAETVDPSLTPY